MAQHSNTRLPEAVSQASMDRLQEFNEQNSHGPRRLAELFLGAGVLRQLETSAVLFAELQVECSPGLRDSRCSRWVLTEPQLTNTSSV